MFLPASLPTNSFFQFAFCKKWMLLHCFFLINARSLLTSVSDRVSMLSFCLGSLIEKTNSASLRGYYSLSFLPPTMNRKVASATMMEFNESTTPLSPAGKESYNTSTSHKLLNIDQNSQKCSSKVQFSHQHHIKTTGGTLLKI